MKMDNDNLAANDKQNVDLFAKHLSKVYNNKRERFADVAKFIRQREIVGDWTIILPSKNLTEQLPKLWNGGAPGITEVPPEAFKCLEGENRKQVYLYIVEFWEGRADYAQWYQGLGVMVPQKGDLSNPNKWRGINLMDVCSKIFLYYEWDIVPPTWQARNRNTIWGYAKRWLPRRQLHTKIPASPPTPT